MTQYPMMNKAARTRLENAEFLGTRIIYIDEPIYPTRPSFYKEEAWIQRGRYEVIRDFDEDRYLIRVTARSITVVNKSLTRLAA